MALPAPIYFTIVILGALLGAYTGWQDFNSDYDAAPSPTASILSYVLDRSPISIPIPRTIASILTRTKKDRSIVVGTSRGFKYAYRTADLNRLTRSQRDIVRAAVDNYFETHTDVEIDALIVEGDELARADTESWTRGTGTACLKLDDKWGPDERWGPLEGFMKLGREEQFDENVYCGPTFTLTVMRPQFTYAPVSEVDVQDKRVKHEDRAGAVPGKDQEL